MKMTLLITVTRTLAFALLAAVGTSVAYGQMGQNGGGSFGGGSFGGGTGGSSSGYGGGSSGGSGGGGSSSSLFNSGSSATSGSSSSLFNNTGSSGSSGSSMGSSGSSGSSGSNGSSGATGGIQTATIGAGNTPIQRGQVITRDTGGVINSNYDVIGGQAGTANNQFANMISQIGRQANQGGNFNQQGGRNAARPIIRIPLRLGFVAKPFSGPQFSAKFESRVVKLNGIATQGPIRIAMDGSTAVLTGVVATEQDRQLAEGVAMLEPEVETVRNELTVQEPASSSDSPATNP